MKLSSYRIAQRAKAVAFPESGERVRCGAKLSHQRSGKAYSACTTGLFPRRGEIWLVLPRSYVFSVDPLSTRVL